MTNHYAVLGIGSAASPEAIKSAYRQKARRVHPDAGHKEARDFHAVQAAYQVLSDPRRRAEYDRAFREWLLSVGRVLCERCGVANHVPSIPAGFHPTCGSCGMRLHIDEAQRRFTARAALTHQVVGLVEDVGGEVLSMVKDAAVEGLARLRERLGIRTYRGRR